MKQKDSKQTQDKRLKNNSFIDAWKNAIDGIIYATTTQSNIKKQLIIAVIVVIISLFFNLNRAEFLCFMFTIVLIIFAEMVNTAIETVVDLYTDIYHPKAKIAKDVGAGAVVITALNALIVAYFLFFEKISTIGTSILESIARSPAHLAFVAIVLTIIAVVALKAASSTNKHKRINKHFCPSGQSAIAFAAMTAIWLNTKDIVTFTLSLVLSLLIIENRIDTKKRTMAEVIFGACMGVLIVLLVYSLTIFKQA